MARERGLTVAPFDSILSLIRVLKNQRWDIINAHTGRTHTWAVLVQTFLTPRSKRGAVVRTRGDARPVRRKLATWFVTRRTSAVIAASEHIRRQYQTELGVELERSKTIYPYIEVDDKWVVPPEYRVGVVGRLDVVKGHAIVIEAAAHVLKQKKDVKFIFAGQQAD